MFMEESKYHLCYELLVIADRIVLDEYRPRQVLGLSCVSFQSQVFLFPNGLFERVFDRNRVESGPYVDKFQNLVHHTDFLHGITTIVLEDEVLQLLELFQFFDWFWL